MNSRHGRQEGDSVVAPRAGDALIIVDVQNDFLPGGALPVAHGDEIIPALNAWIERFAGARLPVIATRDWHPSDHCSFSTRHGRCPPHCVADTPGAAFPATLRLPPDVQVISKAMRRSPDNFSAFSTSQLDALLCRTGTGRLFVGGLATDYCVRKTVLDALELGYGVVLLLDAMRAMDAQPGDGERAIETMCTAGAVTVGQRQFSEAIA